MSMILKHIVIGFIINACGYTAPHTDAKTAIGSVYDVYKDVEYRFRQSREIATCVLERALMDLSGDIDFAGWDKNDMALVMFNPAP